MPTRQYNCVFDNSETDDAFSLRFISQIGRSVVLSENIVQLEYGLVVLKQGQSSRNELIIMMTYEEFLFDKLVSKRAV